MNIELIETILPHGSGINYDWEINTKGNRLYIHNAWNYMDENGFYKDARVISIEKLNMTV